MIPRHGIVQLLELTKQCTTDMSPRTHTLQEQDHIEHLIKRNKMAAANSVGPFDHARKQEIANNQAIFITRPCTVITSIPRADHMTSFYIQ